MTDALTGLGNRRALIGDLERRLVERRRPRAPSRSRSSTSTASSTTTTASAIRPATRCSRASARSLDGRSSTAAGTAYRHGRRRVLRADRRGRRGRAERRSEAPPARSREHGEGFAIGCSYGAVVLPERGATTSRARCGSPTSACTATSAAAAPRRRGSRKDVLLRALARARPRPRRAPCDDVADLAAAVPPRRSALPADERRRRSATAAELHDVGKVAIPDAILDKPGRSTTHEWEFIRRHTLIGERIIGGGARRSSRSAELVRSSHERCRRQRLPRRAGGRRRSRSARGSSHGRCDAFDATRTTRSIASS